MAEEENNQPVTQTSGSNSLLHRIKSSVADNVPLIPEAFRNSADVIQWIRRGSSVRALLVIAVRIIQFRDDVIESSFLTV
jgi:hypothetical protein